MKAINPYLNFKGNAEEAFGFYRSVFGGEFLNITRFKDSPESAHVSAADANKLMHISLPLSSGNVLMGTDAVGPMGDQLVVGNNFTISISPDSEAETKKLFDGLSAGGKIEQPLDKMFWGAYFGMFIDKFGVRWMLNFEMTPA